MTRFLALFLFVTLSTFVASAAVATGGSVPGSDFEADYISKLIQSGSFGLSYAGGTMLAIRWLGIRLLASKDNEIELWRKQAVESNGNVVKAAVAHAAVAEALQDQTRTLKDLNSTLSRVDSACETRARAIFQPKTPPFHSYNQTP